MILARHHWKIPIVRHFGSKAGFKGSPLEKDPSKCLYKPLCLNGRGKTCPQTEGDGTARMQIQAGIQVGRATVKEPGIVNNSGFDPSPLYPLRTRLVNPTAGGREQRLGAAPPCSFYRQDKPTD